MRDFEQFLTDFADAIELGVAGELDEGLAALDEAQREAEDQSLDATYRAALAYRHSVARRVYERRFFADSTPSAPPSPAGASHFAGRR